MKVSIANNQKKQKLPLSRISRQARKTLAALGLNHAELSVVFASPQAVRKLNNQYRGIDSTTDVLSFAIHDFKGRPSLFKKADKNSQTELLLGDVIIDPQRAALQAAEIGHPLTDEIDRLIIHGLLHLLGYDHEAGAYRRGKMLKAERDLASTLSNTTN